MPTVEERLASLEVKVDGIVDLRREMHNGFAELRHDVNVRFTEVNERFIEMNGRITELRDDVNRRIGGLDAKVDRHFVWLMGMMVTGFITVIGALAGSR